MGDWNRELETQMERSSSTLRRAMGWGVAEVPRADLRSLKIAEDKLNSTTVSRTDQAGPATGHPGTADPVPLVAHVDPFGYPDLIRRWSLLGKAHPNVLSLAR